MRLTFPRTHDLDDIWPLYAKYKDEFRDSFQEWLDIERDQRRIANDELKPCQKHIMKFLADNSDYDGMSGLIFGWMDFRKILIAEFDIDQRR